MQRRAVRVLVTSQVLGGVAIASGVAVGGLLAEQVSGSTSLSGLAQTGTVIGAALLALPMARLAASRGRRPALALGYGCGLVGAVLAVVAAVAGSFGLLLPALVLFGGGTASNLQARYAATDAAEPAGRARALSVVVWATTVGAVAGPNLSGLGGRLADRTGIPPLAGPFLFSVVAFLLAGAVVAAALRPDPMDVVRDRDRALGGGTGAGLRATMAEVAAHPPARLGLTAVAGAHAVMVGVMVMTPVHLGHAGASLTVVGIVISAHIAGMYAASPLMGLLTDRIGATRAVAVGVGMLALALGLAAVSGTGLGSSALVGVALATLGLGWSCCLVAGSTLLSGSVRASARTGVQGLSDLSMGVAGGLAGGLAGPVLAAVGYGVLSLIAAVLLLPAVGLLAPALRPAR